MDKDLFDNLTDSLREAIDIKGKRKPAHVTTSTSDAEAVRDRLEPSREKTEPIVFHTFDSGKKFDMSPEDIKKCLADLDAALDEKILSGRDT